MKISAIVPVYNTEKYVGRCIDSIIAQTFRDWELILVDDGSKDTSLEILKKYERQDSRIKVVHQDNAGPGIARNTGLKQASGEYIVFIDSDDRIMPDYFEKLSQETADVVFIDINQVDEEFHVLKEEHMSKFKSLQKDDFIRNQMTGKILWGGVRKAAKRELLQKNGIAFTDHKVGEESIYSFLLMHNAESFSFIEGAVYEYVNRNGSQSDTKDDDPWGEVVIAFKEQIQKMGLYNTYANTINAFNITAAIVSLDKMAQKYNLKTYNEKGREKARNAINYIDSEYSIDTRHMPKKAAILYPLLKCHCILPIYLASKIRNMIR